MTYLALLRGINVGGKNMIKMADLRECLSGAGFSNVCTYIQSGNVIFESDERDSKALARAIEQAIDASFKCTVGTVVIAKPTWRTLVSNAPSDWGVDKSWKHNILVLLDPSEITEAIAAIGALKPDIETLVPGDGVLYQSMSLEKFGRTTTGKLASNPIYQRMTVRNYNTAVKLAALLEA